MAKAIGRADWFAYFPEDYRWSAAVSMACSVSYWGGATMGEIDQAGKRLKEVVGDDEAWFDEWTGMGDRVRRLGLAAERKGNDLTAATLFKRACTYYQLGERFRTPKDRKALGAYRKSLDCFERFTKLTDTPRIERVEIPFEGDATLPAWLVHAENTKKAKPPRGVFRGRRVQYISMASSTSAMIKAGAAALDYLEMT